MCNGSSLQVYGRWGYIPKYLHWNCRYLGRATSFEASLNVLPSKQDAILSVLFSHLLPTQIMWEVFQRLTIYSQGFLLSCGGQWEVLKPRCGRKWATWEGAPASWTWEALGRDGSALAVTSSKHLSGGARERLGAKITVVISRVEVEWGFCFKWEVWAV